MTKNGIYPDVHGTVRTVKVGMRKRDQRESALPYVPKPLQEIEVGVQRIAVICPVEEQVDQGDGIRCGQGNVENEDSCEHENEDNREEMHADNDKTMK